MTPHDEARARLEQLAGDLATVRPVVLRVAPADEVSRASVRRLLDEAAESLARAAAAAGLRGAP